MSGLTVVALSGGVDSATVAGLLVEAGERVVGISMRLYNAKGTEASSGGRCCGPKDLEDARKVCAHLDIPFYVANYEEDFKRDVIDQFVNDYAMGRTPNPCVQCNMHIKFTPLMKRAKAIGATSLATGHYARIVDGPGGLAVARAVDVKKDQSYFLFGMPHSSLSFVRFPLGGLTKDEVRAHARRLGLPNADKPESMEICFIPDGDHASFVASKTPMRAGDVVDEAGYVVGHHEGIQHFTVGQRKGLGSLRVLNQGAPLYVTALDAEAGTVKVGSRAELEKREIRVADVFLTGMEGSFRANVQIRHRHAARPALVEPLENGCALVHFDEPERAVAPGQAAVFYVGDRVVGGGFIQ